MILTVPRYLKKHPVMHHAADFKAICQPLNKLGINYFSHVVVDKKNHMSGMCTSPEYFKHYTEREYHNSDIHNLSSMQTEQLIFWDDLNCHGESEALYEDLMRFKIGHTFTIIQRNQSNTEYFHFATTIGNPSINHVYLQNLDTLKKFIMYYKESVQRDKNLFLAYDLKLAPPKDQLGFYCDGFNKEFSVSLELPFKRFYVSGHECYITQREMECLHWLAHGKSIDETAKIMGLTSKTIKHHIKNMKVRLNCHNLCQLGVVYSKLKDCYQIKKYSH